MSSQAPEPEGREQLEDERDFLLRSLDDLDGELVAGNIDADTYRVLHDDYTARASAVIQSLADGVDRHSPDAPRVPPLMRLLTIGGIVVFAVLAAILLAHTIGQRNPGQEITGDSQAGGTPTTSSATASLSAAQAAAKAAPKSYPAQIAFARALLDAGAIPAAIQQFVVASKADPTQPEPLAYAGGLTTSIVSQVTDANDQKTLLAQASRNLDQAIALDPTYPDSYAFKGVLLAQYENKPCPGAVQFQEFLVRAPTDHPLRSGVVTALAQAVKVGKCPGPSTSPTTKP
jgi:hypothetical protein